MSDSFITYRTIRDVTDADRAEAKRQDADIRAMLEEGAEQQRAWEESMALAIRQHKQAKLETLKRG